VEVYTAILTDAPEKKILEQEQKNSKNKSLKAVQVEKKALHPIFFNKPQLDLKPKKEKTARKNIDCSISEDEEFYCLLCCEAFSTARKNKEMCVQCVRLYMHAVVTQCLHRAAADII